MENLTNKEKVVYQLNILRISSLAIVLFLFIINEGYYSFEWVKDIRSWVVFGIYIAIVFTVKYLSYKLIKRFYTGRFLVFTSILLGTPLSLLFLFKVIY